MARTHAFNLRGAARKPLIEAIEGFARVKGVYQGAPKFGYAFYGIGVLDKEGSLHFDCDMQVIMDCVTYLENCGFACDGGTPEFESLNLTEREELGLGQERRDPVGEDGMQASDVPESYTYRAELSDPECPDRMEIFTAGNDEDAIREAYEYCEGENEVVLLELHRLDDDYEFVRAVDLSTPSIITIEVPFNTYGNDVEPRRENLHRLIGSKASLIRAALGTDAAGGLPIEFTEEKTVRFAWLRFGADSEVVQAWSAFLSAAVKFSMKARRVTAKDTAVTNEKFAFRTFLVKIGMNDIANKAHRRQLLKNLTGDAAFATPESKAKWQAKHMSKGNEE